MDLAFCPIYPFLQRCQELHCQPIHKTLSSLFLNSVSLLFHLLCKKAPGVFTLLLAGSELQCEARVAAAGLQLAQFPDWSWTGNVQQLSSKSITTASYWQEQAKVQFPHVHLHPWLGTSYWASDMSCKMVIWERVYLGVFFFDRETRLYYPAHRMCHRLWEYLLCLKKTLTVCKSCFTFHSHIFHKNYWKPWQSDIWANKMGVYCIQAHTVSHTFFLKTHCANQMSLRCDFPHRYITLQVFKIVGWGY